MHSRKSGGFSSDEGEMPDEGDGIHPDKKTRRKSEKEMRIFLPMASRRREEQISSLSCVT
jgi:hypothetical protein